MLNFNFIQTKLKDIDAGSYHAGPTDYPYPLYVLGNKLYPFG